MGGKILPKLEDRDHHQITFQNPQTHVHLQVNDVITRSVIKRLNRDSYCLSIFVAAGLWRAVKQARLWTRLTAYLKSFLHMSFISSRLWELRQRFPKSSAGFRLLCPWSAKRWVTGLLFFSEHVELQTAFSSVTPPSHGCIDEPLNFQLCVC